jgi:hypothetical protein
VVEKVKPMEKTETVEEVVVVRCGGGRRQTRRRRPETEKMKTVMEMICRGCLERGDDRWSVVEKEMEAAVISCGGGRRSACRRRPEVGKKMKLGEEALDQIWILLFGGHLTSLSTALPLNNGSQRIYIYISHITYKIPKFG